MKAELAIALLADTALSALVGDRIKWDVLRQGARLPAIRLFMVSAPRDYDMEGREPLVGHLVQLDVIAGSLADREDVARALVAALDALSEPPLQAQIENHAVVALCPELLQCLAPSLA